MPSQPISIVYSTTQPEQAKDIPNFCTQHGINEFMLKPINKTLLKGILIKHKIIPAFNYASNGMYQPIVEDNFIKPTNECFSDAIK